MMFHDVFLLEKSAIGRREHHGSAMLIWGQNRFDRHILASTAGKAIIMAFPGQ